MNTQDLQELKELALAATPGPWDVNQASAMKNGRIVVDELYVYSPEKRNVAIAADIADPDTGEMSQANANYIAAANPAAILELIAIAERTSSAGSAMVMSDATIREIFLANGFTIKDGCTDLKPYVYAAARAILSAAAVQPAQAERQAAGAMSDEQIREIFMAHGFTIKEGQTDLKPYVFAAARALLAATQPVQEPPSQQPVAEVKVKRNRVWIKRGVQSFMLAYEADNEEELNWYADQLRTVLTHFTPSVKIDIKAAVDRFLGWRLPNDFQPDAGISFLPPTDPWNTPGLAQLMWPIGTNLFTADQAKAMFEYCYAAAQAPAQAPDSLYVKAYENIMEIIGNVLPEYMIGFMMQNGFTLKYLPDPDGYRWWWEVRDNHNGAFVPAHRDLYDAIKAAMSAVPLNKEAKQPKE